MTDFTLFRISFALTALIFMMTGCRSSQIPLSEAEKTLVEKLNLEYGGRVWMQHDRDAVRYGRKDGEFMISLENSRDSICMRDSTLMIARAKEIMARVLPVMEYREQYQSFIIWFSHYSDYYHHDTMECWKEVTLFLHKDSVLYKSVFTPRPKIYSDHPF